MTGIRVTGLDHLVLVVADVERSLAFYCSTLGLAPVRVEQWRAGTVPFPSVRITDTIIVDLVARRGAPEAGPNRVHSDPNLDHFCVVVEPIDFAQLVASGHVDVVDGPGMRHGAQGDGWSLYVRDPDGNVVELRQYGGGVGQAWTITA
jgi:catechol 2,3-dioxygenase-like lactoylglutathione lyase family enzyme